MAGLASNASAVLLIVCGAVNALLSKIVYQLEAPDCSGTKKPFEKPWLQTALMFVAMAMCLPIAWVLEWWKARQCRHQRAGHLNRKANNDHQQRSSEQPDQPGPQEQSHAGRLGPEGQAGSSRNTNADDEDPSPSTEAAVAAVTHAAAIGALVAAAESSYSVRTPRSKAPAGPGSQAGLTQPLLASEDQHQQHGEGGGKISPMKEALLLCIPTGFDLAATTIMNVGLLYVAASVFQILRGAEMLFAAFFAVVFLRRPLNRWHYLGVALCMAGLCCVGASRMLAGQSSGGSADSLDNTMLAIDPAGLVQPRAPWTSSAYAEGYEDVAESGGGSGAGGSDPNKALLGMCLILLSQAIQAGQVTVEDHLMSDLDLHPLKVVGWEGVIGSVVMLAGALPLLQHLPFKDGSGLAEDTRGSWCMVKSSPLVAGTLALSSFAVLLYNIFGMFVTESVGAAARTVLENARTLLVWLAALGLYYFHIGGGKVGEAWDNWSWLQAVGFAVFASGAFMYDKGHKVHEEEEAKSGRVPHYSKWAVLKSTLGIHTGHLVGVRKFRAVGNAVLAGVRMQNGNGYGHAEDAV